MSALVLAVVALCFITLDLGGGSLQGAHSGVRGSLGSLYRGTDTVLGPVRRMLPPVGVGGMGLDLSPIIVLLLLRIVVQGLILNC